MLVGGVWGRELLVELVSKEAVGLFLQPVSALFFLFLGYWK